MLPKNLQTSFIKSWNFTRGETLEILNSLSDKKLQFKPKGKNWKPLYYQFVCMGRTQMVYTQAINSGWMDFSLFQSEVLPKKEEFQTKAQLIKFLSRVDRAWVEAIRKKREIEEFTIRWPGAKMPILAHIMALSSHERLHHGQIISYFTQAGFELPVGFKRNWAL